MIRRKKELFTETFWWKEERGDTYSRVFVLETEGSASDREERDRSEFGPTLVPALFQVGRAKRAVHRTRTESTRSTASGTSRSHCTET
jgi:hypothetical protein